MLSTKTQPHRISPIQRRLLALQNAGANRQSILCARVRLDGVLRSDLLCQCIAMVIDRHEILQTTFHRDHGHTGEIRIHRSDVQPGAAGCDYDQPQPDCARSPLKFIVKQLAGQSHCLEMSGPAFAVDFGSLLRLVQEIAEDYRMLVTGQPSKSDPPLQYSDVAEWLVDVSESKEAASGRKYWREAGTQIAGTSFLIGESNALVASERNPRVQITINPSVTSRILEQEKEGRWKAADYLLTAWRIVLQRLGYDTRHIAVSFDCRSDESLHDVIGPLTQYLPVFLPLRNTTPFLRCIQETGVAIQKAANWQQCFSWETLTGDAAGMSYFSFAFDHVVHEQFQAGPDLLFSMDDISGDLDQFGMCLSCQQSSETLALTLAWQSHLFSQEEIDIVTSAFTEILADSIKSPETAAGALDITGSLFKEWLAAKEREATRNVSAAPLVHKHFLGKVQEQPDAVALIHLEHSITYESLGARVDQVASGLQNHAVKAEALVGILLDSSPDMVIAVLGVLRAGAAFVLFDTGVPGDQISPVIKQSGVSVILSTSAYAQEWYGLEVEVLDIAALQSKEACIQSLSARVDAANPAFVAYIPTPSGELAGVMITHEGLRNYMALLNDHFPLTRSDRILQNVDFSRYNAILEILPPLVSGSVLVMA